jgi:hypothetical protein
LKSVERETTGKRLDAYIGSLRICESLSLDRARDRLIFSALLDSRNPYLANHKSFAQYVDLNIELENKIAKSIQDYVKRDEAYRLLSVAAFVYAFLEHSGYLDSTYVDTIANSNPSEAVKTFRKMISTGSDLRMLKTIVQRCKENLNSMEDAGLLLKSIFSYNKKIINYRNLNSYSFSRMYESIFSRNERKAHGIYTTPRSACISITKNAYKALTANRPLSNNKSSVALIDISCGAGNFCEAAVETLFASVDYGNGTEGIERRGSRYQFTIAGQDLNPEAVTFAEAATLVAIERRLRHPDYIKNEFEIDLHFTVGDSTSASSPIFVKFRPSPSFALNFFRECSTGR